MSEDGTGSIDLAVLMGAQRYPQYESLDNPAFGYSCSSILQYLQDEIRLRAEHILNLFDDPSNVIDFDERLHAFLSRNPNCKNIFVYYVGHGGFLADREYYLAIQSTRKHREYTTGLRIKTLAQTLGQFIDGKILILILDCCFAGEAVATFQSPEIARLVESKTFEALPAGGTALLVAASKDEPAISPINSKFTMFSESFLEALTGEFGNRSGSVSLREACSRTQEIIRKRFGQIGVRPEVHSPRQKGVDPADIEIFPNRFREQKPQKNKGLLAETAALDGSQRIDEVKNEFLVPRAFVPNDYVSSVAEEHFDVTSSLSFMEETNRQLVLRDSTAVSISRGDLVLQHKAVSFWHSLFDEACLQGHRTLVILLYLLASTGSDKLRARATSIIESVIENYHDQKGRAQ